MLTVFHDLPSAIARILTELTPRTRSTMYDTQPWDFALLREPVHLDTLWCVSRSASQCTVQRCTRKHTDEIANPQTRTREHSRISSRSYGAARAFTCKRSK